MKQYILFSYLGGPGGPICRTQVNEYFRTARPHHRADINLQLGHVMWVQHTPIIVFSLIMCHHRQLVYFSHITECDNIDN